MLSKYETLQALHEQKVVAVIRGESPEEAIAISRAAVAGGIRAIEVTYTTPNVAQVFTALQKYDLILGTGTVLDAETARHAILHGAKFIVSPHFSADISTMCNRYAIPYLPGCLTIAEMVKAAEHGHEIIKLFPANNFSPSFINSVKGPLPHIQIMPTGGISLDSIQSWLDGGAFAAGVGSDLSKAYRNGGEQAVQELAQSYRQRVTKESE